MTTGSTSWRIPDARVNEEGQLALRARRGVERRQLIDAEGRISPSIRGGFRCTVDGYGKNYI